MTDIEQFSNNFLVYNYFPQMLIEKKEKVIINTDLTIAGSQFIFPWAIES